MEYYIFSPPHEASSRKMASAFGFFRCLFKQALSKQALRLHAVLLLMAVLLAGAPIFAQIAVAQAAPQRVVSINLCTDQLAMLIADEGQLHAVSVLARDPYSSAMAEEAESYTINHAQAEEIFLMEPDLVLAGTYSSRATISLLRRLGIHVEEFTPAASFAEIRADIERIGALLQQQERAAELVAELDEGLALLEKTPPSHRKIALYDANSYTTGADTLTNEVFHAAGLVNIAETLGITGSTRIPLELLITAQPDLIATSYRDYGAPALAQENFTHPAFAALETQTQNISVATPKMICGAPFTLDAAFLLQRAASRGAVAEGQKQP